MRFSGVFRLAAATVLALGLDAAAADALLSAQAVPRPTLPRGADRNDWTAYYDLGVRLLERGAPRDAEAAFIWAGRIDPERAEPLFGRWVVFWYRQRPDRWRELHQTGIRYEDLPGLAEADSLRQRAVLRNPFVPDGLELVLYNRAGVSWRGDPGTQAWLAYTQGSHARALRLLSRAGGGDRDAWVSFMRAKVYVAMQEYDGALAEIEAVRALAEARDATRLSRYYLSKAPLDHAAGMLHLVAGRPQQAREAAERGLLEDLSFAPVHELMGRLALARGDAHAAADHYRAAMEIDPADVMLRFHLGAALLRGGSTAEAVEVLRDVVAREPHYAAPMATLGAALESLGEVEEARRMYAAFLASAPASADAARRRVQTRLNALGAP